MTVKHVLEVYEPGSVDDVWTTFEAEGPFACVSRGDLINPGLWPDSEAPQRVLRVLNVEHAIWEGKGCVTHKVMVYTREVSGRAETLLSKAVATRTEGLVRLSERN